MAAVNTEKTLKNQKGGFFPRLKMLMARNRLGELMVLGGVLTSGELRYALARQRVTGDHLGRVLLKERMISRQELYSILAQQWTLRALAGLTTILITFSVFANKQARAGTVRDIPAQVKLVSAANSAFASVDHYPALFGADERRSTNLGAFTKWSGMFNRFEASMRDPAAARTMDSWKREISAFRGQSLERMVENVNAYVNRRPYILDNQNWGSSDYWATPVEFFQRGGDCEDFAIAKYVSLRSLGVPEDRLRIAIVHDKQKNIPHAVLVVYTDNGALILDNQNESVMNSAQIKHRYRPIFSINRAAWWLHSAPTDTVVASR